MQRQNIRVKWENNAKKACFTESMPLFFILAGEQGFEPQLPDPEAESHLKR